jgi:6-phosphogluconolactonase (cycloisomerase 2 family)
VVSCSPVRNHLGRGSIFFSARQQPKERGAESSQSNEGAHQLEKKECWAESRQTLRAIQMKKYQIFLNENKFSRLALFALGLALAGCGGGSMMVMSPTPVAANASFLFVANTDSNSISAFQVDPKSGTPTQVAGSPFAAGMAPEFMATDAAGKFLFVANSNSNDVSAFTIDNTKGTLSAVSGSPFPTGSLPKGLAVVSSANLVFVVNNASSDISVFKFDSATGALTPVAGSPFKGVPSPIGVTTDALGKFLYVTNTDLNNLSSTNSVSAFSIDSATGMLTAVAGSPFSTGTTPIGLVADPNGMFVYVGDHMADVTDPGAAITPFNMNSMTGSLSPARALPPAPTSCGSATCHVNPLRLAIHPVARFAYVANVGANSVSAFSLHNGSLSLVSTPVATGQHPFGMAFDPTGSFLFVANKVDNTITGFSVNSMMGTLTPLASSPFSSGGSGPVGIVAVRHQ